MIKLLPLATHSVYLQIWQMNVLAVPMYSSVTFPKQTRNKNTCTTEEVYVKRNMKAIRVTIVVVEKQYELHILSGCL